MLYTISNIEGTCVDVEDSLSLETCLAVSFHPRVVTSGSYFSLIFSPRASFQPSRARIYLYIVFSRILDLLVHAFICIGALPFTPPVRVITGLRNVHIWGLKHRVVPSPLRESLIIHTTMLSIEIWGKPHFNILVDIIPVWCDISPAVLTMELTLIQTFV